MANRRSLRYFVTPHAMERYQERVGGDGKRETTIPEILAIVKTAIVQGRKSKRKPRWLQEEDRPKNRSPEKLRYVWDVHEQIGFVICEHRWNDRDCWYIVTCLTRLS